MKTILATPILLLALLFASPIFAEESVDVLRGHVDELKGDLDRPLDEFNTRYEQELSKLKETAQTGGNLDLALAASDEIAKYKEGGSKPATDPKLKRLQEIYAKESARIKKERAGKLSKLLKGYLLRLQDATSERTKAGDLDGALTYRNEAVNVESQIASLDAVAAAAAKPDVAPTTPQPEEDEKDDTPRFVAGVYQMGEGFGPNVTFDVGGRYNAGLLGSGSWKARGSGRMILNSSDEFNYDPKTDTWKGTINLGGEREIVLKLVRATEKQNGGDESNDGDRRRPGPRRPGFGKFRDRD